VQLVTPLSSYVFVADTGTSVLDSSNEGRDMVQALVAGMGLIPRQSTWDLWWIKWHLSNLFCPSTSVFLCRFPSTIAPYSFMYHRRCNISSS